MEVSIDPTKQLLKLKREIKSWENRFSRKQERKPLKEDIQDNPEIRELYKEYQRLKIVIATGTSNTSENKSLQQDAELSSKISTAVPLKPSNTIFGAQLNKKSSNTHLNKEKLGTSRPQKTFKWIKGRGFQTEREESESDKDSNVEHVFDKSDIPKTLVDINSLGSVNVTDTTVPSSYPLKSLDIDDDVIDPTSNFHSHSVVQKPKLGHRISTMWLDNMKTKISSIDLSSNSESTPSKILIRVPEINLQTADTCFNHLNTTNSNISTSSASLSCSSNPFLKMLPSCLDSKTDLTESNEYNGRYSEEECLNPHSYADEIGSCSYTDKVSLHSCTDADCAGSYTNSPSSSVDSSSESVSSIETCEEEQLLLEEEDTRGLLMDEIKPEDGVRDTLMNDLELYQKIISSDNEQIPGRGNERLLGCGNEQVPGRGNERLLGCGNRKRKSVVLDKVVDEVTEGVESDELDHSLTTSNKANCLHDSKPSIGSSSQDPASKGSSIGSSSQDPTSKRSGSSSQDPTSKGSASDNFVRLNMKIKRFSRKPLRITGSKYKRQQWKQRERTKVQDYEGVRSRGSSSSTCFRCGRPGHWARNCTNNGGFKNLGKFDGHSVLYTDDHGDIFEEGEDPRLLEETGVYPTVEEACRMLNMATGNDDDVSMETSSLSPDRPSYEVVDPFLQLQDGKVLENPTDEILSYLNDLGHKEFRNGQSTAILQILSGVSTILVQPTGAGKSLCYQLPAYCYTQCYPGCITLVISPLISLMQDQINNLPSGIVGACIHSGLNQQQRSKVTSDITAGKINILLISPETLVGGATGNEWSFLSSSKLPPIAFACIDEAHCLSEWSHNFRPSYLRLCKILRYSLGIKCILALTATASNSTINDMAELLSISKEHIIIGSAVPDNLILSVSCEEDREKALIDLLHSSPFSSCASIIVYCTRQQTTERIAQLLRTSLQLVDTDDQPQQSGRGNGRGKKRKVSWSAECYHAGLSAAQRKRNQSDFMSGRLRVIVCTVAFGMGLNKSDVRSVIHYNMPKSFESFVQEIGRAGRDGDPAYCHVFIDREGSDLLELRRHIYNNSMDSFSIKQLIKKALPSICNNDNQKPIKTCHGHEVAIPIESLVDSLDTREEALLTLLCYLELQGNVNLLNPINDTCRLKSYGGVNHLKALAKKIPAIAMAVAIEKEQGSITDSSSSVTFSNTQVANALHCNSNTIHQILKDLRYSNYNSIIIEFDNLAFHFKTKRCFTNDEKDSICQCLLEKVKKREEREIERLYQLYTILKHVSTSQPGSNSSPKEFILAYFKDQLTIDYLQSKGMDQYELLNQPLSERRLLQLRADIRSMVSTHDDRAFTGRAVARILQGISSPCFPAEVWGRKVFNWRKYLDIEFNSLCKIATEEIIKT